jgi:hypothetical protein
MINQYNQNNIYKMPYKSKKEHLMQYKIKIKLEE